MDFLHLFRAGGFMMYPLILCSLVVVAIFIERFRYYRSNRSHVDQLSREIPKYLEKRDYEGLGSRKTVSP
jgi:biopolymer transport protein ExbB